MSKIDVLRRNYQRICGFDWDANISGAQRVWFVVYDKEEERKLRLRIGLFEEATHATGHQWDHIDLTDSFANWLTAPPYSEYAEDYFRTPDDITGPLQSFKKVVAQRIIDRLENAEQPENTVVAVSGIGSLFGFLRVSEVLPIVEPHILGRVLVFFPGVYEQDNYRLLDARDGWNYRAVPILATEGESNP